MFARCRFQAKLVIKSQPLFFRALASLCPASGRQLVDKNTTLVIEGFPRSGNTFAVVAFRESQTREVRLAHHYHAPAQVILGVKWRVPTLVLVRDPIDAVTSLVIRHPEISLEQGLKEYIWFYSRVFPYREEYVVGAFQVVISDFGSVISQINKKYGTRFDIFEHSEENVKKCFAIIEELDHMDSGGRESHVARPSVVRREKAANLREAFRQRELSPLVEEARGLYGMLIGG